MLSTEHSPYGMAGKGDIFRDPSRPSVGPVNANIQLSGLIAGPAKSATAQCVPGEEDERAPGQEHEGQLHKQKKQGALGMLSRTLGGAHALLLPWAGGAD